MSVNVYGVANPAAAATLVERCRQIHAAHPDVAVSIVVQSNSHIDNLHLGTTTIVQKATFSEAR